MEDQIFAFLAGSVLGIIVLFVALVFIGASGADPDDW